MTSRRALGLDGEHLVGSEALPLPAVHAPLAAAAANPAVALFVDRARAARGDFHLSERNREAIISLVRALQGMPLAIELAASRVRSLPPAEMVAMLQAGDGQGAHLALLARGGPRAGHDPRHASMAQVIAWSWRLLDDAGRQAMGALTLWADGASVAGLAAQLGRPLAATAAQLDDLMGQSLLCVGGSGSGDVEGHVEAATRFGLVEPVREFVAAQLPAGVAADWRRRQRAWLIAWARGLGPRAAPARVASELTTVHAVLVNAAADGAPYDALALAMALRWYWDVDALPARIQLALARALDELGTDGDPATTALRADAHELLAHLRFEAGLVAEARAHAEAALCAAGSNDPSRRARALVRAASIDIAAGQAADRPGPQHAALRARLDEALALACACGDREAQASALHQLGVLLAHVRVDARGADPAAAEALFAQSQAIWLALNEPRKARARLRNRAQCWAVLGRADIAMAAYEQCEKAARDEGDWVGQIDNLLSMSALLGERRQWAQALDANRRCVALCWQRWQRHGLAVSLWNSARLLARLRQPEPAIQLMGFAARFWPANFGALSRDDARYVKRVRALVAAQIGPVRAEALWHEGASMDIAAAVRLVLQA